LQMLSLCLGRLLFLSIRRQQCTPLCLPRGCTGVDIAFDLTSHGNSLLPKLWTTKNESTGSNSFALHMSTRCSTYFGSAIVRKFVAAAESCPCRMCGPTDSSIYLPPLHQVLRMS
jgi:hypothetical protein